MQLIGHLNYDGENGLRQEWFNWILRIWRVNEKKIGFYLIFYQLSSRKKI